MAKIILKYEASVLKEIPVQKAAINIGRSPANDVVIDNLAVSGHHARLWLEEGRFLVEDLNSLNGTFLNNQRIRKSTLKDGDEVVIGKHTLLFKDDGGAPVEDLAATAEGGSDAPNAPGQTMVLDTKKRREFLAKVTSIATEGSSEEAEKVGCLVVMAGRTGQSEYILTSKMCMIGKDNQASVRLKGWFLPKVCAIINRNGSRYDIAPSEKVGVTKLNGTTLTSPQQLKEGDLIEIKRIRLKFYFRE